MMMKYLLGEGVAFRLRSKVDIKHINGWWYVYHREYGVLSERCHDNLEIEVLREEIDHIYRCERGEE